MSSRRRANTNCQTGTSKVELERSWNGRSGKVLREAALVKMGGGVVRTGAGEVKQRRTKAAGTGTDKSLPGVDPERIRGPVQFWCRLQVYVASALAL